MIWSAIGGSAAILPGVRADVALPIAGTALAIFSVVPQLPGAIQEVEMGMAMEIEVGEIRHRVGRSLM